MEVYQSSRTAAELEYALGAVPSIGENGNWWIGNRDTGIFAKGINVTGAEVGQTVKIAAVDENGVPTEWEPVGMAKEGWSEIFDITYEEDGQIGAGSSFNQYANGEPLDCSGLLLIINGTMSADITQTFYSLYAADNADGTDSASIWTSSRNVFGATGSSYISSTEIVLKAGVASARSIGGQYDTSQSFVRYSDVPEIIRCIKIIGGLQLAAGSRVAMYGRK